MYRKSLKLSHECIEKFDTELFMINYNLIWLNTCGTTKATNNRSRIVKFVVI
jgi:hypothetical protein